MTSSIISNGVEAERLAPPNCEQCSAEAAVILLRISGTPIVRQVCQPCLIDNDGRTGWPFYADVMRGFAA